MKMNDNNDLTTKNARVYFDPFFDEFFDFGMPRHFEHHMQKFMRTDVTEEADSYLLSMELPGFKKEDVALDLENGYLTICATKSSEESDKKNYIRHERLTESCKRSFYVGDGVTEEDVDASMEDGILKVKVMKKTEKVPKANRILIK